MWGAIAGALMAAGGAALNAINQSSQAKKQRLFLQQRQKENEDNYNNSKYDHTQSATAQYQNTQSDKKLQEAVDATNSAVTTGNLNRAKTLGQAMEARADRDAQEVAQGEAQERADRDAYLQRKDSLDNAQMQLSAQQAANSAAGMQSVVNAGANLALADISSSQQTGKGLFGEGGSKGTSDLSSTAKTGQGSSIASNLYSGHSYLADKSNAQPISGTDMNSRMYNMFLKYAQGPAQNNIMKRLSLTPTGGVTTLSY